MEDVDTDTALHLLFPRKCPGCGVILPEGQLICEECAKSFRHVEKPVCMLCGRHIEDDISEKCPQCAERKNPQCFGISVFRYDAVMKKAMSDFKFNGRTDNADFFIEETVKYVGKRISNFAPMALIPVPVHKSRRAERGYNQTEILCNGIGKKLGIRVVSDFLLRTRKTGFQKKLGKQERGSNLTNAFSCNTVTYPRERVERELERVFLVDDIYTTGSTMRHCCEELIKGGVKEVALLSICIGNGF